MCVIAGAVTLVSTLAVGFERRRPAFSYALLRARSDSPRSGGRAIEPREFPGRVDQKQVARIVEIFTDEFLCRELELDFVVADRAGRKNRTLAGLQGELVPLAKGYIHINRCWLHVRVRASNELPFAGILSFCSTAWPGHHREQDQGARSQSVCLHHGVLHCLVNSKPAPHTASVNVVEAIRVNVLTLEGRNLVEFHAIAIARTTSICLLLFAALSRRDGERLGIALACLDRCGRQCERTQEYEYEYKRKNAGFHVRTCSGLPAIRRAVRVRTARRLLSCVTTA